MPQVGSPDFRLLPGGALEAFATSREGRLCSASSYLHRPPATSPGCWLVAQSPEASLASSEDGIQKGEWNPSCRMAAAAPSDCWDLLVYSLERASEAQLGETEEGAKNIEVGGKGNQRWQIGDCGKLP